MRRQGGEQVAKQGDIIIPVQVRAAPGQRGDGGDFLRCGRVYGRDHLAGKLPLSCAVRAHLGQEERSTGTLLCLADEEQRISSYGNSTPWQESANLHNPGLHGRFALPCKLSILLSENKTLDKDHFAKDLLHQAHVLERVAPAGQRLAAVAYGHHHMHACGIRRALDRFRLGQ